MAHRRRALLRGLSGGLGAGLAGCLDGDRAENEVATRDTPSDSGTGVPGSATETNSETTIETTAEAALDRRRSELTERIEAALAADVETTYAEIAGHTVDTFREWIAYDAEHPDELAAAIGQTSEISDEEARRLARALPATERADCLELLEGAIGNLEARIDGEPSRRAPPDRDDWPVTLEGRRFTIGDDVVFPSTITWMPHTTENVDAFGGMANVWTSLQSLDSDGTLPSSHRDRMARDAAAHDEQGLWWGLWYGAYRATDWMKAEDPAVTTGGRHFTAVDVDNPNVRDWVERLLAESVPLVREYENFSHLHMTANEPHFATAEGGWAVGPMSEHTMNKFRGWLRDRYPEIEALNERWETSFADFDAVEFTVPVPRELRGSESWYDWCRFNMDRVTDWFEFLHRTMKTHDPAGLQTIKYVSGIYDPERSHGLDFEALCRLQEVPGCDFHTTPKGARSTWWSDGRDVPTDGAYPWEERYALQWRNQTANLDFMSSVAPGKPIYDSEWHGFSTNKWRDPEMSQEYVRAALWLSFLHGTTAMQAWYWSRGEDGQPESRSQQGFWGSLGTQPVALAAYGQTMQELNACAGSIDALAGASDEVSIFYSEESAIQNSTYPRTLRPIHEALALLGYRVGFLTETMLTEADSPADEFPAVVLPPAKHLSDSGLAQLRGYVEADGTTIAVGEGHYVTNEYGEERPDRDRSFLSSVPSVPVPTVGSAGQVPTTELQPLQDALRRQLKGADVTPAVQLRSEAGDPATGVVYQSVETADGVLVGGVAVGLEDQPVALETGDAVSAIRDVITGERVDGGSVTLSPPEPFCLDIETAE